MEDTKLGAAAIEKIQEMAAKALLPAALAVPEPKDVATFWNPRTGEIERIQTETAPLTLLFDATKDLLAWALETLEGPGSIFYDEKGLTGVRMGSSDNGAGRRELATMPLPLTEQFATLFHLKQQATAVKPVQMWNFLRTFYHDALPPDVIGIFKEIKISGDGKIEVAQGAANRSVRRSTEDAITGAGAIPETLAFNVRVFEREEVKALRYTVRVAVIFDGDQGTLSLMALEGELVRAQWAALGEIMAPLLGQSDVAVWRGAVKE